MRALLLILIVAVGVILIAFATGFVRLNQSRGADAPEISATRNGVTARGGQAPAFDVETGSVKIGTKESTVKMPTLVVEQPARNKAVTNNAQ